MAKSIDEIFGNTSSKPKTIEEIFSSIPNQGGNGLSKFAKQDPITSDDFRAWKGDLTQGDILRMQKGDVQTLPQLPQQQDNSFLGNLDTLLTQNPVSRTIDSFVSKGANALTFGFADKLKNNTNEQLASKGIAPIYQSGDSTVEKIAGGLGTFAGSLLPIGGAYKLTGGLVGKLAPNAPKLADRLLRGAAAGTAYGAANELADVAFDTRNDGAQTFGQRAKNVGLDAALFGVGDAALYGVGKGLKYAADKTGLTSKITDAFGKLKRTEVGLQPSKAEPSLQTELPSAQTLKSSLQSLRATDEAATAVEPTQSLKPEDLLRGVDITKLKDRQMFKFNTTDIYRNLRDVFGDQFPKIKETILEPFNKSKENFVNMQKGYLNRLQKEVVEGLGIKKGSKLSALVQKYGEGKITLEELKKVEPKDWENVVKADGWFRKEYDNLIDQVNAVRARIYRNQPDKLVPKRKDYYRHFRELNGLEGLANLFDTPSAIDPSLVGITHFTKPNSRFAGFMQKRGLGPYKNDAVGGFLNYIQPASYAVHIDPQIGVFKGLAKELATKTADTKNMNNFIEFLQRYSQDLAGKTNSLDRTIQEYVPGGRKTMAALKWFNNRVKANVILGNLGSTLSQVANIPNGVAFAKQYSVPGAGRAMVGLLKPSEAMKKSAFLNERFIGKTYRQFDTNLLEQPRRFAEWMMETADRIGTYFVWNSAYSKGLAEGVENAVKYADDETRKLIAGRGIGEVPLAQKANITQLLLPFQLEVANQWRVMGDFVKGKDLAGLMTLFVASYVLNRGFEQIRGSGVLFDPIRAIEEAMQEDLTLGQRAGRLAGEVLSNLPGGQTIAAAYPQYGGNLLGLELPTRKALFGDNDPTRFGSGILAVDAAQDPLYKALLPFGGNQLKKTLQGAYAVDKKGDYQYNYATDLLKLGKTDENKLRYPIDFSNPLKQLQTLSFGPAATKEGRDYYKNERRPLSEKQTQAYELSGDKQKFYNNLMRTRRIDTAKRKINEIKDDKKLTITEKQQEIAKILDKIREQKNK